jgi:Sulfotransferase family
MVAQLDSRFVRVAPGRAASRLVGYSLFEGRPVTTKGQWWNPVVFANLRRAAQHPGARVDRPVFIVGMGRSGTTLLGRILAAHPDVGFLNEPKAMWHVVNSDEDIIGSYAARPGRLHLDADDADPEAIARCHALFAWYLRLSRSRRVVDKYPELVFRTPFVRAIFPDARFLVAVRSPWSTLKSVSGWSATHGTANEDWWGVEDRKWKVIWEQAVADGDNRDLAALDLAAESDHYVRAAVEWLTTMRKSAELAESDPHALLVPYEELSRRPGETIADILAFCELRPSPRTEAYAEEIVSASDRSAELRREMEERLPAQLVSRLEETWSRLCAIPSGSEPEGGR